MRQSGCRKKVSWAPGPSELSALFGGRRRPAVSMESQEDTENPLQAGRTSSQVSSDVFEQEALPEDDGRHNGPVP